MATLFSARIITATAQACPGFVGAESPEGARHTGFLLDSAPVRAAERALPWPVKGARGSGGLTSRAKTGGFIGDTPIQGGRGTKLIDGWVTPSHGVTIRDGMPRRIDGGFMVPVAVKADSKGAMNLTSGTGVPTLRSLADAGVDILLVIVRPRAGVIFNDVSFEDGGDDNRVDFPILPPSAFEMRRMNLRKIWHLADWSTEVDMKGHPIGLPGEAKPKGAAIWLSRLKVNGSTYARATINWENVPADALTPWVGLNWSAPMPD